MAAQVNKSLSQNDNRQAWSCMRILGGTGRRERKRNVKDVRRFDPTPHEWAAAMALEGGQGGCEASVVQFLEEGQGYDRREVLQVDAPRTTRQRPPLCTPEGTLQSFKSMKYLRGVPQGRARKELY